MMRNARFCTLPILSESWTERADCHTGQHYSSTDLIEPFHSRDQQPYTSIKSFALPVETQRIMG